MHKNWSSEKNQYFAPIDVSSTAFTYEDIIFKYVLSEYGVEKMHLASDIGTNFEKKLFEGTSAYHFDGHKVGQYFKNICEKDGIKTIDSVVKDVIVNNKGEVTSIVLKNSVSVKSTAISFKNFFATFCINSLLIIFFI